MTQIRPSTSGNMRTTLPAQPPESEEVDGAHSEESQADHLYCLPPPTNDFVIPANLPSLEEITRTRVNTLVFIPIGARNDVTRLFRDLIFGVTQHPVVLPRWTLLFIAAKCIMAAPPTGGQHHHKEVEMLVRKRVKRWKDGEVSRLWAESKSPALPKRANKPSTPTQEQVNVSRCQRLVQEGQYSRAIQALVSCGLDQDSREAHAAMVAKHPSADMPTLPPKPAPKPPCL